MTTNASRQRSMASRQRRVARAGTAATADPSDDLYLNGLHAYNIGSTRGSGDLMATRSRCSRAISASPAVRQPSLHQRVGRPPFGLGSGSVPHFGHLLGVYLTASPFRVCY
jgi:hypothetical protein